MNSPGLQSGDERAPPPSSLTAEWLNGMRREKRKARNEIKNYNDYE
ncbi:MAG: hypothetical protein KAT48_08925 [Bacteroidales bacterium]|nr:hypothetical protein [Bacteroidales bacterium]